MTHNLEPARGTRPVTTLTPPPKSWWRSWQLWLGVLAVLIVFNAIYALPRYLSGDPAQVRILLDQNVSLHYPLVVAHVVTGNIAMVTLFFQLWPWLRRNHPRFHRISGRVHIFAGALPSALFGFAMLFLRPGPAGSLGLALAATGWIFTILIALKRARQRRIAEHRRWMVYSFAFALSTSWGRIVFVLMTVIPGFTISDAVLTDFANWASWVVNLLVAHWWLERSARRRRQRAGRTSEEFLRAA